MDPNAFELTLEQQFEVRRLQQELQGADRDQMISLLLQVAETIMVKDNLIRDLIKKVVI
jgi:hypothetical protein